MKKKAKVIVSIAIVFILICTLGGVVFATSNSKSNNKSGSTSNSRSNNASESTSNSESNITSNQMADLGKILSNAWKKTSHPIASKSDSKNQKNYAVGKNAVVGNQDIEIDTKFYKLNGISESEARSKAIKYEEQRQALYQAAIANGYSVTDKEVKDYLETLKATINSATNKDDVKSLISQFDSEDDYWKFEFKVYKKDLPIQKYVHSLEEKFNKKSSTDSLQSGGSSDNGEWTTQYEKIKKDLVKEQKYKMVK